MNQPTEPPRHRLLLLDGHSLAYRAFFALPVENFSTTTGQPTNAVYGFTSMLINVLRDEEPTHVAVAFDVSRKTFRTELFAEYKANRTASPTDFRGQVDLIKEVLDALRIPIAAGRGLRGRRRHRHAHHAGRARGLRRADLHRRPRRAPAGQRPRHRALPAQGRLRHVPVHAGGGAGEVRPHARRSTPTSRPCAATRATTCPTSRAWGRRPRPSGSGVRRPRPAGRPGRRGQGQGRRRAARAPGRRCCGTASSPSWSATCRSRSMPGDLRAHQLGPRRGAPGLRHPAVPGAARPALRHASRRPRPEAEEGFEVDRRSCSGPGEVAPWLAEHARDRRAHRRARLRVPGAAGTGDVTGVALATADGEGGWFAPERPRPGRRAGARRLARRPEPRPRRCTTRRARRWRSRARGWELRGVTSDTALSAYLALPGQRTFDLADLALRYLHRELRAEEADDGGS